VTPDTVLVLRGAGPIGAGMPEAARFRFRRKLARAGVKDMVRISDARMSAPHMHGDSALSPESAAAGQSALVRDGDPHPAGHANRRLDLLIDNAEWSGRPRRAWHRRQFRSRLARLHAACPSKRIAAAI
jgi:dihydroxy-acid dehydratase